MMPRVSIEKKIHAAGEGRERRMARALIKSVIQTRENLPLAVLTRAIENSQREGVGVDVSRFLLPVAEIFKDSITRGGEIAGEVVPRRNAREVVYGRR